MSSVRIGPLVGFQVDGWVVQVALRCGVALAERCNLQNGVLRLLLTMSFFAIFFLTISFWFFGLFLFVVFLFRGILFSFVGKRARKKAP
jgi:hypothetical protein